MPPLPGLTLSAAGPVADATG